MPKSRRRVPKERPPQGSNNIKALMRRALSKRMQAEREAIVSVKHPGRRLEEAEAIKLLKDVPTIFYFAEAEKKGYFRPQWASDRWGAR